MPRQVNRVLGASLNKAAGFQSIAASYCYPLLELSELQWACTTLNRNGAYNPSRTSTHADQGNQSSSTDGTSRALLSSAATAAHFTAAKDHWSYGDNKLDHPTRFQRSFFTKWIMQQHTCSSRSSNASAAVISSRGQDSSTTVARCFTTSNRQACSSTGHTADDLTLRIEIASDLQQLQQLLEQAVKNSSAPLTAAQLATAYCQAVQVAAKHVTVVAVQPILDLLQPAWNQVVQSASIQDISVALYSWAKLGYANDQLWSVTLAAVPGLCKKADGQDLSNIAYAIAATAEARKGSVPGVRREEAEEVMRAVTHELVTIVQNTAAGLEDGRSASIANISTMRWAHETFEQLA